MLLDKFEYDDIRTKKLLLRAIKEMSDIEPLTIEALTYIIDEERPDGIIATLGGQTGLNLAVSLNEKGILEKE